MAVLAVFACSGAPHQTIEARPPPPRADPPIDAPVAPVAPVAAVAPDAPPAIAVAAKPATPVAMAEVPAARLRMGSLTGHPDERPVHAVDVAAFSIDLTEVTVGAYAECVAARRCATPTIEVAACDWNRTDLANYPINCVSWTEAAAYCAFAGKRLPTEEEWELAARGTDGRIYPWGNGAFGGEECELTSIDPPLCRVASAPKGKSAYGVFDMTGNADEWTASAYCPYARPGCTATQRTTRGGSSDFIGGTATSRNGHEPNTLGEALGFRCASSEPHM